MPPPQHLLPGANALKTLCQIRPPIWLAIPLYPREWSLTTFSVRSWRFTMWHCRSRWTDELKQMTTRDLVRNIVPIQRTGWLSTLLFFYWTHYFLLAARQHRNDATFRFINFFRLPMCKSSLFKSKNNVRSLNNKKKLVANA